MYKLNIGRSGLLEAAELEKGCDLVGGYTEIDLTVEAAPFKEAICIFMKKLRLEKGLNIAKLSKKIDVSQETLDKLEHEKGFKPDPRTLLKLSQFYKVPMKAFVEIVGAKIGNGTSLANDVVEFAFESESLEKLSKEETKLLKQFVDVLRREYGD
jgi:transcriptional regulator with XRE-family HTH domain